MGSKFRTVGLGTAAAALIALTLADAATATTIAVNTTADAVVATDGKCSLREAVTAASTKLPSGPGAGECAAGTGTLADVVSLGPGHFVLTGAASDNNNASGDIDVRSPLTIQGAGAGATTIDGGGVDRVIDVPAPNVVTLSSLTISGGRAGNGPDGPPDLLPGARDAIGSPGIAGESGGGIRLLGAGMLTVRDAVISGNRSGDGGDGGNAVANDGGVGPNAGFAATGGAGARGGDGGGIDAETGTVVVSNSTIAANMTGNGGDGGLGAGGAGGVGSGTGVGGVGAFGTGGAGGNAGFGAGILAADLTMTASTVSDNTVGHGGSGGIGLGGSGGPAPSTGSSGALGMGGAGGAAGGGAAIDAGRATIDATTISANVAGLGGTGGHGVGGDGGAASAGPGAPSGGGQGGLGGAGARGVLYATASLTLRNSTVTANGTAGPGPGGAGDGGTGGASGVGQGAGASFGQGGDPGTAGGGAIDARAITGTLIHDTIVGNAAAPGAAGAAGHGGHGGAGSPPGPNGTDSPSLPGKPGAAGGIVFASPTGGPTTSATVIQNTIVAANSGNNCFGTPVDGGHDITFPGATCPGKVADPLLRPLADNGGPTRTIAPLAASPAVDAIPNSGAGCLATDQRGVQRPQGPACDSGAFELTVPVVSPPPGDSAPPPPPVGGTGAPSPGAAVVDHTPPTLTRASLSPTTFAVDPKGAAAKSVAARTTRLGTTIRYTLSEPARVVATVERASHGRLVGRTCKRSTNADRHRRACTRYTRVGRFAIQSRTGQTSTRFRGRIGRTRLSRGTFRLTLVATDAAGNASGAKHLNFRVVAAK